MSADFALALIAGIGLPISLALLGGMIHLVWMLASLKTTVERMVDDGAECKKKHSRHDSDFKDVRGNISEIDGRVQVLESSSIAHRK